MQKIILIVCLLLFYGTNSESQYPTKLTYSVSYETKPPVEKGKTVNEKPRERTKKIAKQKTKKKPKTVTDAPVRPGFIIMALAGVGVAIFAIYLGTLLIPWSAGLGGCSLSGAGFLGIFVAAFAWFGWVLLCIIALALIVWGIILTIWMQRRDSQK